MCDLQPVLRQRRAKRSTVDNQEAGRVPEHTYLRRSRHRELYVEWGPINLLRALRQNSKSNLVRTISFVLPDFWRTRYHLGVKKGHVRPTSGAAPKAGCVRKITTIIGNCHQHLIRDMWYEALRSEGHPVRWTSLETVVRALCP